MTRHSQGRENNCLQVCLASIFDAPIEEPPDISRMPGPDSKWTNEQWRAVRNWVAGRGWRAVWIEASQTRRVRKLENRGGHYIANGPSGGGTWHSVVMKNGDLVHDPSGAGLTAPPGYYIGFEEPGHGCLFTVVMVYAAMVFFAVIIQMLSAP